MKKAALTKDSKIKDIYANPIGHDIIYKILLQMGKNERLIDNAIVGNMRIGTLCRLAKGIIGEGFLDIFLRLLNSEQDYLERTNDEIKRTWWKESIVYQIYPRSFKDSNDDGIGDINGIIEKLDYLKELGIDVIWLSPVYDSPNDDNGYDIRDYQKIMKEFGTMEDFDRLLEQVHSRGMRLIMDLVVNHTSDEHQWFQDSLNNPNSPYKDYYIWKSSSDENPPNNWTSFFSGTAWNYYEQHDEWALHLFSKKQMDLNWENEKLRADIYKMINWWLGKGVDGFRLDVINYISKQEDLPDGDESIGKMMGYYGIEHYFYGHRLHEYLKDMRRETFDNFDVFTVGETPGIGMEMSRLLTSEYRKELDMIFSFDHLENPGKVRFDDYKYDLNYLKEYLIDWMQNYGNDCWMTLFFENHDNPRMISKINQNPRYRNVLGKLLAMIQLTLKGTPFIYQGQELGMINVDFSSITQFRDVESINLYNEMLKENDSSDALKKVLCGSRDHARTPVQWTSDSNAGFSTVEPWIYMNDDYKKYNIQEELKSPSSILNFYKSLIAIRKSEDALVYGDFIPVDAKKKNVFCYYRKLGEAKYYVELNLTESPQKPTVESDSYELILSNYESKDSALRAYESNLYKCQ